MKAAYYPGNGGAITIETLPDPEPKAGEVLIKVHRCGVCGTDFTMTQGSPVWDYGAGQFGHEYSGEIIALGKGVEGLKIGDPIAAVTSLACGQCEACHYGNNVMCRNMGGAMFGFSELAVLPANAAVPLPKTLSMADGALIEPLAICRYGVRKGGLNPGDRVLVLGAGAIGAYTAYWARAMGAGPIVVASRSDKKKDMALAMGADRFVTYGPDEVAEVAEALGGPPDVVYECVGVEGMLGKALNHVRMFGKVISLGFCVHPDPIMPAIAAYKCASMQFYVGYETADFHMIADSLDRGHADVKLLLSKEVALDDFPDTFAMMRANNNEMKVHVYHAES